MEAQRCSGGGIDNILRNWIRREKSGLGQFVGSVTRAFSERGKKSWRGKGLVGGCRMMESSSSVVGT